MLKINESLQIRWLGHGGLNIDYAGMHIYIDPYKAGEGTADYILVTHSHDRHLSAEDINRLRKDSTFLVLPADATKHAQGGTILVQPGVSFNLYGLVIETTPAYNLMGKPYHPKSKKWVGYILNLGGTRVYHAGDTDDIPEMKKLKVDVAFLPISGRSVMTAKKAAEMVNHFKPGIAVPIHWDGSPSAMQDAAIFKKNYKGDARILRPEGS